MAYIVNLETHFHEEDKASVLLESNVSSESEEIRMEQMLFCYTTIRVMVNLKPGAPNVAKELADLLSNIEENYSEIISDNYKDAIILVDYPGKPAQKSFYCSLDVDDNGTNYNFGTKGFGLLGKGINYYAPAMVLALFKYLVVKRASDEYSVSFLKQSAIACGQLFNTGKIIVSNQREAAEWILAELLKANG